jgi:DNA-binding XRE family transcriptional regulator
MKKNTKRRPTTTGFFSDPEVRKIMADPKRKAGIDAKYRHLEFLEDIEKIRKSEGLSQNDLARLTKISQMEISRIEHGKRNITLETYFRIINSLGYEPVFKYRKIHHAQI